MDQALYEIFARIREMYKAAVSVLNDTIDNTDSQFVKLIYAYAVLKGCRMKLIQTEKYASKAEEIFEKQLISMLRIRAVWLYQQHT